MTFYQPAPTRDPDRALVDALLRLADNGAFDLQPLDPIAGTFLYQHGSGTTAQVSILTRSATGTTLST
jgi:uncharacterized protein YihD (DUF1040 family)